MRVFKFLKARNKNQRLLFCWVDGEPLYVTVRMSKISLYKLNNWEVVA